MKSTQLLSVVFSLIMFTGVTAGNAAFAESDDLDDILEDFCELDVNPETFFVDNPDLAPFRDEIVAICELPTEDDREDAIDEFIIDNFPDAIDESDDVIDSYEDCVEANGTVVDNECTFDDMVFVNDEDDETDDDVIDSFEDCVEAGYDVMESYPEKCMIEDGTVFVNDDDEDDDYDDVSDDREKVLVCHKGKKTLSIDDDAIRAHLSHGDYEGPCDGEWTRADNMHDKYSNQGQGNLHDRFAMHCDLTPQEREERIAAMHDDLPDDFRADLARYCEMTDEEQDDFRDRIMDHMDVMMDRLKDKMHTDVDMRKHMDRFCAMSDVEQQAYLEENEKPQDKADKILEYCSLDEDGRAAFIEEHRDEYRAHMKDKLHDKMGMYSDRMHDYKSDKKHMDYDRLCELSETDRALEITDAAKLDRISDWCEMTPEEREDYKKEHHDEMKDKEKHLKKMMKYSEKSDRLKAMIMDKRDISDERADELRMKFEAKFGDDSDKKRSEIKMKYKDHMLKMKFKMSDERKSDVHERLAEMKAYKAELREKSSDMTDEEKQQLREEFIEKAKDMQLAWISPRTQITAGVDPAEVECREGYSLVMKASNGVAMCLKADTALKMIDRGIVVPAN